MNEITLYTIGFTKKSAQAFFGALRDAHVRRVIDVRLNNVSQLAGFAKKEDLSFFLHELCACEYVHEPAFAPTQEMLDAYRKKRIGWSEYEAMFRALIAERGIERALARDVLADACLLCSEPTAEKCHRRLVAEYLGEKLSGVEVRHL